MIPKRIRPGLLACLSIALLAASCARSKPAPTKEHRFEIWMDVVNAALSENDATGAMQGLLEAEKIDSENPEIPFARARAYSMRQDFSAALLEIRKFIEKKPASSDGQLTEGILLIELNRSAEAVAPLEKAANDPAYERAFQAQTNLGILYYRKGEYKVADHWLNRAASASPALACVAHYYRGHIHLRASNFRGAAEEYQLSTKQFCGTFGEGFLALGTAYQSLRDYDHARRTYLEVQERFPNTKIADQAMERLRKLP